MEHKETIMIDFNPNISAIQDKETSFFPPSFLNNNGFLAQKTQ